MKKIKIILTLILSIFINTNSYTNENVFIVYNVNNELITSIDIKKELQYLIALNSQLKNLNKEQLLDISKESILRETIKKNELSKYFDLDKKNPLVDEYVKNFYQRLNMKNEIEFQEFLKNYEISINFVKKKLTIELTWNQLIYDKFKSELRINEAKILKEIKSDKNESNEKIYSLSEIVFERDTQNDLNKKKKNIDKSIKEIGFKNSANIYSISDSSKFGGEIGWVAEKELSKKIFNKINNLKIGEYTDPINTGSSFLILKIEDIKYEKKITDVDQEMGKRIKYETDRQLQQYSKIYYNKVKINTDIDEL